MPQDHAKLLYTKAAEDLLGPDKVPHSGAMGPVVSRLLDEAAEDDADVPVSMNAISQC